MLLMIPEAYQRTVIDANFAPPAEMVAKMMKFNEQMVNAGILVSLDGLQPPAKGARVSFAGGKPTVTQGGADEPRNVLGGYWIIKVTSRDDAIEWARQVPALDGDVIEVRQIFDMEDFPADVQAAADSETVRAAIEAR
ncbi:MAG: YciI family protein [Fimbriimonadaceae bacterium]